MRVISRCSIDVARLASRGSPCCAPLWQPRGDHAERRTGAVRSSAMPALVRRTVRCPCGRRSSTVVLAEGQEPLPLPCTAECERHKRRARLADAFGVPDPEHYVPVQVRSARMLTMRSAMTCDAGLSVCTLRLHG